VNSTQTGGILRSTFFCVFVIGICSASYGLQTCAPRDTQTVGAAEGTLPDAPAASHQVTLKGLPLAILKDQLPIWASPARIRPHDLIWLMPLSATAAITLATDTDAMRDISHNRTFNKNSVNASNYMIGGEMAVPVTLFGIGLFKNDDRARATGILSGEAFADAVVVEEVWRNILRRERPLYNNAAGHFFSPNAGTNGSFPSSHSALSWSVAAVIAGQYPSRWVQVAAYTTAAAVSLTRVLGQEHFPTDVLVGSAAGWLIGRFVFVEHRGSHSAHGQPAHSQRYYAAKV
jgi:membrane-associated phospholipid phosphatase